MHSKTRPEDRLSRTHNQSEGDIWVETSESLKRMNVDIVWIRIVCCRFLNVFIDALGNIINEAWEERKQAAYLREKIEKLDPQGGRWRLDTDTLTHILRESKQLQFDPMGAQHYGNLEVPENPHNYFIRKVLRHLDDAEKAELKNVACADLDFVPKGHKVADILSRAFVRFYREKALILDEMQREGVLLDEEASSGETVLGTMRDWVSVAIEKSIAAFEAAGTKEQPTKGNAGSGNEQSTSFGWPSCKQVSPGEGELNFQP
jgi:hypothetical protein